MSYLPRERQRLSLDEVSVLTNDIRQRCLLPKDILVHDSLLLALEEHVRRLQFGQKNIDEGTKRKQEALLHSLGISKFEPGVLAAHVSKMLPNEWKNKSIVRWDPSNHHHPSLGWMKMFWNEIDINKINDVHLFDPWPLVPLKNMELMSCSLMECGLISNNNDDNLRKTAEKEEERLLHSHSNFDAGGDEEKEDEDGECEAELSF